MQYTLTASFFMSSSLTLFPLPVGGCFIAGSGDSVLLAEIISKL